MICPICRREKEMAYSVLSHGFVCLEQDCGFEVELDDSRDADIIYAAVPELICA